MEKITITIKPKPIGRSWYFLIPNDFIKYSKIDTNKNYTITLQEEKP